MVGNILTLHNIIDKEILDGMKIEQQSINLAYEDVDDPDKLLTLQSDHGDKIFMGDVKEFWDPNTHNLKMRKKITILQPDILFGINGVATETTKIGVAYHIYSKSSGFQTTKDLGIEITSGSEEVNIEFIHEFPPASIKGEVNINILLFVKDVIDKEVRFANKVGVELGVIDHFQLVVDGEGSVFPIVEVERQEEPLWHLITKWSDIVNDPFDSEYVRLELNRLHPMYDYIFKDTKPSAFLLSEILSNVMTQIIFKAVNDDDFTDVISDSDSIANIVNYWIDTYEVDTTSFESISYSLRNKMEDVMSRGG